MKTVTVLLAILVFALGAVAGGKQVKKSAKSAKPVQEFTVVVKDGYTPDMIEVKRGVPVRLNFKLEEHSCTGTVVFKDLNIKQKLEYGKVTPVEFTPKKSGSFGFACPMNMVNGTLVVK